MKACRIRLAGNVVAVALAAVAGKPSAAEDPGIELPPIACATLAAADPRSASAWMSQASAPAIRKVAAQTSGNILQSVSTFLPGWQSKPVALELGPNLISVAPGTTTLIEVAINHLNRIVTPFASPVVHTVSNASTQIDGRVIYVATTTEEPVALYVSDGREPETALSLTLAPRYVPPREVRIQVPGYRSGSRRTNAPSAKSATAPLGTASSEANSAAHPYAENITELLRAMAQKWLPPGYKVSKGTGKDKVRCIAGLKASRRQVTAGPLGRVLTIAVRNSGKRTVLVDQQACTPARGAPFAVAAVAAWPLAQLAPGESTEVFLVLQAASAFGAHR